MCVSPRSNNKWDCIKTGRTQQTSALSSPTFRSQDPDQHRQCGCYRLTSHDPFRVQVLDSLTRDVPCLLPGLGGTSDLLRDRLSLMQHWRSYFTTPLRYQADTRSCLLVLSLRRSTINMVIALLLRHLWNSHQRSLLSYEECFLPSALIHLLRFRTTGTGTGTWSGPRTRLHGEIVDSSPFQLSDKLHSRMRLI